MSTEHEVIGVFEQQRIDTRKLAVADEREKDYDHYCELARIYFGAGYLMGHAIPFQNAPGLWYVVKLQGSGAGWEFETLPRYSAELTEQA